jgi:hypothetical protein
MPNPPFWIVWNENGGPPRVKHATQQQAEAEAQRLAEAHPGDSFCVLPCASRFSVRRVNIERFEFDTLEVPF